MKVLIKDLYSGPDCFKYSEEVESYIANNICADNLNTTANGFTEGYAPEYDFKLGNKRIELKITSKSKPQIEFARGDGRVSGLLLSEADYYLILSPGGSKGKLVGKLRLFKTAELKEKMVEAIYWQKVITHNASDNSPGSMCYGLEPREINDIWVGDCDLIFEDKKVVGYDLETFKPSFGKFINEARRAVK